MLQTLFYIPNEIAGIPLFGFGWVLLAWAIVAITIIATLVRRQGWNNETLGYVPILLALGGAIYYVIPRMIQTSQGLPIRGFGVLLLLGVVSGVGLSVYRARRMGVDPEVIFSLAFWMFLFGILGARVFYVIEYRELFIKDTFVDTVKAMINVPEGGIVLYGAFFGGIGAAITYFIVRKLPALAMADIIVPGMVVGASLGRVGCFLNGCCFGGLCTAELPAVRFPKDSPPYQYQLNHALLQGMRLAPIEDTDGRTASVKISTILPDSPAEQASLQVGDQILAINNLVPRNVETAQRLLAESSGAVKIELSDRTVRHLNFEPPPRSLPMHPAQLYDAINLALMATMLWLYYPLRRHDGEVLALLLTLYPVTRFVLEVIRVDEPSQLGTTYSISQLISFGVFTFAIALWIAVEVRRRPPALPWSPRETPQLA